MSTLELLLLAEVLLLVPLMSLSDLCSGTNLGLLTPLASPGEMHRGGQLLVRLRSVEIFPRGNAADDGAPIVDFDFFRLATC